MADKLTIAGVAYAYVARLVNGQFCALVTSPEGKTYEVRQASGGRWTCTCEAYKYSRATHKWCKHSRAVRQDYERARKVVEEKKERATMSEQQRQGGTAVATVVPAETGFTQDQVELIKRTIAKGCTQDELALFLAQCKRTGLDPFSRQIHAVKRWDSEQGREVMTIQTGIDGYRLIADRTSRYAGSDEAEYGPEFEPEPGVKAPTWARVTVWKIVGGQRFPYSMKVLFREFCSRKKGGNLTRFWREKPYLMCGKCAESQALRKAFPQELSGIYTHEEMPEIEEEESPAQAAPQKPRQQTQAVPAFITKSQAEEICEYLHRIGEREEDFCAMHEIREVDSLPAGRMAKVSEQLIALDTIVARAKEAGVSLDRIAGNYNVQSLLEMDSTQRAKAIAKLDTTIASKKTQQQQENGSTPAA